jgi:RNA polymerase sigma factor (sigma-70 family)
MSLKLLNNPGNCFMRRGPPFPHAIRLLPAEPPSAELEALTALDPAAWLDFAGRFTSLLGAWCHAARVPFQDIADVLQDVFRCVVRDIKHFQPNGHTGCFSAWLKTVTHDRVVDYFRAEQGQAHALGGDPSNSPLASAWYARLVEGEVPRQDLEILDSLLRTVRAQVHERTWTAFWQAQVEERPIHEIAADLKMTPAAVRMCKSRVLNRLRILGGGGGGAGELGPRASRVTRFRYI